MKRTDNDRAGRFAARFFSLLLTACLLTAGAAGASAAGYESYSYGYATGEAVAAPSPAPYLPERTVSLGALAGVKTAADFCRDAQGNWYVADSGAGQIVVLDADFGLVRVISAPEEAGALSAPTGVCVLSDGRLCVADTGNKRLVVFTPEGEFVTAYTLEGAQGCAAPFSPPGWVPDRKARYMPSRKTIIPVCSSWTGKGIFSAISDRRPSPTTGWICSGKS